MFAHAKALKRKREKIFALRAKNRKAERQALPFSVRLSHFLGVARTCNVYQYVSATLLIHTFKEEITSYLFFFLLNPARPTNPEPKRSMVAGSGMGAALVVNEKLSTPPPLLNHIVPAQ